MKTRLVIYAALAMLVGFVALNWDLFLDNVDGLRAGQVDMDFPFDAISGDTPEVVLARHYGVDNWRCIEDPSNHLGPRQCHVDARTVDGVRALVMVFFFKDGRLAHAKIDLPNWEHRSGARMLSSRYGSPTGVQWRPVQGVRLIGWRIAGGNVFYNIDRPHNPLQWNTVFWMSHREAEAKGGVFTPRQRS